MPCSQKCKEWVSPKRPADGKRYENGQMRCDQCEIWLDPDLELHTHNKQGKPDGNIINGLNCDCCNARISGRAKSARYGKTGVESEIRDYNNWENI